MIYILMILNFLYLIIFLDSFMDIADIQKTLSKLSIMMKVGASVTKWKKLANRTKDRRYRFKELVNTQQDYQKDLISIKEKIYIPLIQANIINQNESFVMFPNVQSMISLSEQLQEELKSKEKNWDSRTTMIGQTMIRFCKFLLVYSDYFKNFNDTQLKIKEILANNAKARQIQKLLSTQKRIITFMDLIAKPFQRPLKYHLILRDYASKVDKSHPDYKFLQEAIECYHKVNQKNNSSLEDKQKGQILMILDQRFGNIIQSQARYFVKESQCTIIDTLYSMFILSDVIIFALKNSNKESYRIYINKFSYIEHPYDGHYFINRIYLYGRSQTLHLTFFDSQVCETIYETIKVLIEDTNKNETRRQEIISLRATRLSMIEKRRSYTNLEPQFKRPMIVSVLGCEKRYVCEDKEKVKQYFILEFHATPQRFGIETTPPHQISYVTIEELLEIENIGRVLYKNQSSLGLFPLLTRPSGVTQSQYKKNENRRIQIQTIFIQLFLNNLFRNEKVLKRIDFVTYLLKLCEPLWMFINEKHAEQYKNYKNTRDCISHCSQFFQEERRRYFQYESKKDKIFIRKKYFSDLKTLVMQEQLSLLPASQFLSSSNNQSPRLIWVKCKLGWINHTMTYPKPLTNKIQNLCIHLCNVDGSQPFYIEAFTSYRVRHIIDLLSKRLGIPLEDYTLSADYNGTNYLLFEDQLIGDIFAKDKEQQGGFFKSLFKTEKYVIKIYLKKLWSLQHQVQLSQSKTKTTLQVQEIIYRLKNEQMKLAYEYNIAIYAFYYAFKHFIEFDTITLNKLKMKNQYFSKIVAPSMKDNKDYIDRIYQVIQRLKKEKNITSASILAERIVQIACYKPGWSCFLFDAVSKVSLLREFNNNEQTELVKIGCDIQGLIILSRDKLSSKYIFKFQNKNWCCHMNGYQLIIKQDNQEFNFLGRDLWKLKKQVQFYRLYVQQFKK